MANGRRVFSFATFWGSEGDPEVDETQGVWEEASRTGQLGWDKRGASEEQRAQ